MSPRGEPTSPSADAAHRVVGQHHAAWRAGGAARRHDQRIAVLDAAPVEVVYSVARRRCRSGAIASSSDLARAQAEGVDRSGTPRRRRPRSAAARRRIDRRREGRSQQGAARSEGYGDARESVDPRRSPAHAPGRGRARGDRCRCRGRRAVAGVVAGRPGAGRQPRAADRRELRQRLQRRRPRHRRRARRPGAAGRRRPGRAGPGEARRVRRRSASPPSPGWRWRWPRRGG